MIWEGLLFLMICLKIFLIYTNSRCKSYVCLVGKTALITGGNAGLGHETAKILASRGCKVIIADKAHAKFTVLDLQKETHNPDITSVHVDLSSFDSVRNFAKTINSTLDRLDILINCAEISDINTDSCYEITKDGLPRIMQVNYFSHFLLVHLLADLLLKSAPCRILNSSSIAMYFTTLNHQNIKGENPEDSFMSSLNNYGISKLSLAVASSVLAEKFRGTGVTSNCYHPGIIKKNVVKRAFLKGGFVSTTNFLWLIVTQFFGKSVQEGAQPILQLAMADEVKNVTGKLFLETLEIPQPVQVTNDEFCRQIWSLSEEIVGLKAEERLDVILRNNCVKRELSSYSSW